MYTDEEYKKRIEELEPIAKDVIMNKRPGEAREMASGMNPDDAYILGMHIGGLLEIGYHKHGNDVRGAVIKAPDGAIKKGAKKNKI